MTDVIVLLSTGLGLAGLYFMLSSGLSLIFGLMGVLNLAHGAFFAAGAYGAYVLMATVLVGIPDLSVRLLIAIVVVAGAGFVLGFAVEKLLIARSYGNPLAQILITIGLSLAGFAVLRGLFGTDRLALPAPAWLNGTLRIAGVNVPTVAVASILVAVTAFLAVSAFLRFTRFGLVIRAGSENRTMVKAVGIDVERSFGLVFALGALLAVVGGIVGAYYFNGITPALGSSQLIFAFVVVVIGGLGSFAGTAVSALIVALRQQFLNFYAGSGVGDIAVVALLAVVLLVRPAGLLGEAK